MNITTRICLLLVMAAWTFNTQAQMSGQETMANAGSVAGNVSDRDQARVHTGGSLRLRVPPRSVITLETLDGRTVSDGTLGAVEGKRDIIYRAPLKVPQGGAVIMRVRPKLITHAGAGKAFRISITEGRAVYLRPFDAFAKEPTGPGRPALPRAEREDETAGRARINAELDRAQKAGFNTVLIEAYYHGYALWPTEIGRQRPATLASGVAIYQNDDPVRGQILRTWDPLAVYLEEGHRRGLEVHVWLESFYVWTRLFQGGAGRVPSGASWLWAEHPDWFNMKREVAVANAAGEVVSVAEDGKFFLDPANEAVQAYNNALIDELLQKYRSLDGIQLDYIRHPIHKTGTAPAWYGAHTYYDYFGFNPVTFQQFSAETGISMEDLDPRDPTGPAWEVFTDWKTRGVTQLVRDTSRRIREQNPLVRLSVSVFPDFEEERKKMQDVPTWVDERLVDIVMPQLYYTSLARVQEIGDPFLDLLRGRVLVYPTFYVPHLYDLDAGAFRSEGQEYLGYAARRNVEGTALFILSGATTGVSDEMTQDLAGPGGLYEHRAEPSNR